jgi:hypothetical protein
MTDKLVVSEKALRQFLTLLETQAKQDKDTIVKLWQQMTAEKSAMCCG